VFIFKTKTEQKQNKITTKTSLKNKTKQIKTHKHTANQKQAFAIFLVFVLFVCCDFVAFTNKTNKTQYK